MKDIRTLIIARIDSLCKEKGLTYYRLAYKSTVPLTTLLHVLDGTTQNPGIVTIAKICDGLEVTLAEFFEGEEFSGAVKEV